MAAEKYCRFTIAIPAPDQPGHQASLETAVKFLKRDEDDAARLRALLRSNPFDHIKALEIAVDGESTVRIVAVPKVVDAVRQNTCYVGMDAWLEPLRHSQSRGDLKVKDWGRNPKKPGCEFTMHPGYYDYSDPLVYGFYTEPEKKDAKIEPVVLYGRNLVQAAYDGVFARGIQSLRPNFFAPGL
jgi:hypothetical protein